MTTRKLLWGMTWRGIKGGLIISLLSILFLLVFYSLQNLPFIVSTMDSLFDNGFPSLNWTQRILVFIIFGLILGGSYGLFFSLLLGLVGGFLLGIYTRVFSFPTISKRYRAIAQVAGGIFGFSWQLGWLLFITSMFGAPSTDTRLLDMGSSFTPAIVNGIASVFIADRIARWYENEMNPPRGFAFAQQPSDSSDGKESQ